MKRFFSADLEKVPPFVLLILQFNICTLYIWYIIKCTSQSSYLVLIHKNVPTTVSPTTCIIILPTVLDVPVNEWEGTRSCRITSSNCSAPRGWSAEQNHGKSIHDICRGRRGHCPWSNFAPDENLFMLCGGNLLSMKSNFAPYASLDQQT